MLAAVKADALVNLTSIPAHFSVNLAALQSGLHVYSQKPLAGSVAEASQLMIDLAKAMATGIAIAMPLAMPMATSTDIATAIASYVAS